jgi:hypothetical protein
MKPKNRWGKKYIKLNSHERMYGLERTLPWNADYIEAEARLHENMIVLNSLMRDLELYGNVNPNRELIENLDTYITYDSHNLNVMQQALRLILSQDDPSKE